MLAVSILLSENLHFLFYIFADHYKKNKNFSFCCFISICFKFGRCFILFFIFFFLQMFALINGHSFFIWKKCLENFLDYFFRLSFFFLFFFFLFLTVLFQIPFPCVFTQSIGLSARAIRRT